MIEWIIESNATYADPFNDIELDVVFQRAGKAWRVPAFWRGGSRWGVRFSAPTPGEYSYRFECSDRDNADLNGHVGSVVVAPYAGENPLLLRGMLKVSDDRRHFEHADGTPFYWLGDTWWTGLSTRLDWDGFQKLTSDRRAKGFTVVQIVAGLVPLEETAPSDPGYANEGGMVWDVGFNRINPEYFDYADRRITHLINNRLVPAIVGAWNEKLQEMGLEKLKKHWRYIVARYAAFPIFWVVGGEVFDPLTTEIANKTGFSADEMRDLGGWTNLLRYVREIDPTHHPVTVHESTWPESLDGMPVQDEQLLDFRMFQSGHRDWDTIPILVSQLDLHYARTDVRKPLVLGELGYEGLGGTHLENFQRVAFWLTMLNGAAGFTYGANGTFESYSADRPFQRLKWGLIDWEEGMNLPGSYQVGIGAKLLREFPWWKLAPRPEWITPRVTTLLEPRPSRVNEFRANISGLQGDFLNLGWSRPESEWQRKHGTFRASYCAGVPRALRIVYIPSLGLIAPPPPTVLDLEPGVKYDAYYWEPVLGVKIELGTVEASGPERLLYEDTFTNAVHASWVRNESTGDCRERMGAHLLEPGREIADARIDVWIRPGCEIGVIVRRLDDRNFVELHYSPKQGTLFFKERINGSNGRPCGVTSVGKIGGEARLLVEMRGGWIIALLIDGERKYYSGIVPVKNTAPGAVGLWTESRTLTDAFAHFQLYAVQPLREAKGLGTALYAADGRYRGELKGRENAFMIRNGIRSLDDFRTELVVLLDAYRPSRLPFSGDWVLVLAA